MAREGARVAVVDLREARPRPRWSRSRRRAARRCAIRADVTRAGDNQALVEQAVAALGPARRLLRQRRRAAVARSRRRGRRRDGLRPDHGRERQGRVARRQVRAAGDEARSGAACSSSRLDLGHAAAAGRAELRGLQGRGGHPDQGLALEFGAARRAGGRDRARWRPRRRCCRPSWARRRSTRRGWPATWPPCRSAGSTSRRIWRARAVFLASDDAAMITGTCIEVDGGRASSASSPLWGEGRVTGT